jgi:hypothetical protein
MDTSDINGLQQPSAMPRFSIRRVFTMSLIASLSISALIAIFVFLFGNFDETETRLILTTLTIGGYCLTGLCSSVLYDKNKYFPFAFSGIIVSVFGFLITTAAIWEIIYFSDVWKSVLIFIILAMSIAHASLLLLAQSGKNSVGICLSATIIFICFVAFMLIYLVLNEFPNQTSEFFYRLLGVFAVLDVLGTIITPILRKLDSQTALDQ